jgi:hypothetical protein
MDHLRPPTYHGEDAEERHAWLMEQIEMVTGGGGQLPESDSGSDDELDWDVDEELFAQASVEGLYGHSCGCLAPDNNLRVACAKLVNFKLFE